MKNNIYNIKLQLKFYQTLDTDHLLNQIEKFQTRVKHEIPLDFLTEWFALVQEITFRTLGLYLFDSQLLAGIFLSKGKIVEMKTGEGKTLTSLLPLSFNALNKKGVHLITLNEYLAERDYNFLKTIFKKLNLSTGLIKTNQTVFQKKRAYSTDITYVTNSEIVFDYLRDNSTYYLNNLVLRPLNYCLLDEIDSILIDEAKTPLILSTEKNIFNIKKLYLANKISQNLFINIDFQINFKLKEIYLTSQGYKKISEQLALKNLYIISDAWILEIINALKVQYFFIRNKDYIILDKKIYIIDALTGRCLNQRRWNMGIHEAIEVKESIPLSMSTTLKNSITYQNFFLLYPKLAGMTATTTKLCKEFKKIYNLDVIFIPERKPNLRVDLQDKIYSTKLSKWKAIVLQIKKCFKIGQPILIGTTDIENSEILSNFLKELKIPHQVLNAKPENLSKESQIIAQAG